LTLTFAEKVDPVAAYAAIVSTGVLIWQIFVWLRTGPQVKVTASSNMKTFGGLSEDGKTYVIVNVRNVGTQQTTITHVVMFAYNNRWRFFRKKPSNTFIVNHRVVAYPIPYVLEIGHTFMSMIVQDEALEKMSREKLLYAGIIHSFSERTLFVRIPPIKSLEAKTK
jgi:hypothetical protein